MKLELGCDTVVNKLMDTVEPWHFNRCTIRRLHCTVVKLPSARCFGVAFTAPILYRVLMLGFPRQAQAFPGIWYALLQVALPLLMGGVLVCR